MQCNSFFEINSGLDPPFIRTPRLLNRGSGRDPPVYYDPPPPPRLFGTSEYERLDQCNFFSTSLPPLQTILYLLPK